MIWYTYTCGELISTIKLMNISITSHSSWLAFLVWAVVETLKINPLCKFQLHSAALLPGVTMLYIAFPELIYLAKLKRNHLPISQFLQLLISTILLSVSMRSTSLNSTYKWDLVFCLSVYGLLQLAQCLLGLCMLLQMVECPFF